MERLKRILKKYDLSVRARACYQCGVCVSGCPVGRFRWDFNPRRFIEMIARGRLEDLVLQQDIWLCSHCLNCLEHCPQKIEVSEVLIQVKNVAARLGNTPDNYVKMADQIMTQGWSAEPVQRILKNRRRLGLPEAAPGIDPKELQTLGRNLDWPAKMAAFKSEKSKAPAAGSADHPKETE